MALPVAGKRDHDVTVITVTFNSAAVIATLLATVPEHVRVIVVDNASSDDTVAVAGRWPNVTVLPLTSNSGFGAACNAGAALCDTPYVFFVNPDAWLGPGCIDALTAAAANTAERAAFNPRFLDQDLNLSLRGPSRFLGRARGERAAPLNADARLDVLHGAAMFMRREDFTGSGGFDTRIFLYFEDDDLSLRLLSHGFALCHVHDALVHHSGGGSTPVSPSLTRFKNYHWQSSELYVAEKHGVPLRRAPLFGKLMVRWLRSVVRLNASERQKYEGRLRALLALNGRPAYLPQAAVSEHTTDGTGPTQSEPSDGLQQGPSVISSHDHPKSSRAAA